MSPRGRRIRFVYQWRKRPDFIWRLRRHAQKNKSAHVKLTLDLMRRAASPKGRLSRETLASYGRRRREKIHRSTHEVEFGSRSRSLTNEQQSVCVPELADDVSDMGVGWCEEDETFIFKRQPRISRKPSFGSSRKSLAADKSLHESAVHAASNCHEERGRLGPLVDVSDREMVIR
jgi:hypothetical protein